MSIEIRVPGERQSWKPGETIAFEVSWGAEQPVEEVEVRLLWRTEGRGDQEEGVVARGRWPAHGMSGDREVEFQLPSGPWSYQGELISILWQVDAVLWPSGEQARTGITLSPTGTALVPLIHETIEDVIAQIPEGRLQSAATWLAARRNK